MGRTLVWQVRSLEKTWLNPYSEIGFGERTSFFSFYPFFYIFFLIFFFSHFFSFIFPIFFSFTLFSIFFSYIFLFSSFFYFLFLFSFFFFSFFFSFFFLLIFFFFFFIFFSFFFFIIFYFLRSSEKGNGLSPNSKPAEPGLHQVLSLNAEPRLRPCTFSEPARVRRKELTFFRTPNQPGLGVWRKKLAELRTCQIRVLPVLSPNQQNQGYTRSFSELRTETQNSGQKHNPRPSC